MLSEESHGLNPREFDISLAHSAYKQRVTRVITRLVVLAWLMSILHRDLLKDNLYYLQVQLMNILRQNTCAKVMHRARELPRKDAKVL